MKFTRRETLGSGQGDLFLKFKDGESKVGILRGEVYEFYQVWANGKSSLVDKDAAGAKPRFRLNFLTKEAGEQTMAAKIFEFGIPVYSQLADINEEYDLSQTTVKITRKGIGLDTVYSILPLLKQTPTAAQLKTIAAIPLKILDHKPTQGAEAPMPEHEFPGGVDEDLDEPPF